jgi:hypothetical protein
MFAHLCGDGKLMITSPSHIVARKAASRTWMQTEVRDKKNIIFRKSIITKNMIKE